MVIKTREIRELLALELQPGPDWASFEQFRLSGVDGLREDLGPDQVGRLNVKGDEFVIMRSEAFTRIYGAAQEIDRLSHQLHLIQQAVQLVEETHGSQMAIDHLRDLAAQIPESALRHPRTTQLVFDENEQARESDYAPSDLDFELDPAKVRPTWTRG
jgi:hypothetical protein